MSYQPTLPPRGASLAQRALRLHADQASGIVEAFEEESVGTEQNDTANEGQAGATPAVLDEESCLDRTRCEVEAVLEEIGSLDGDFQGRTRQSAKWARAGTEQVRRVDKVTSRMWAGSDKTWWSWSRLVYAW